MKKNKTKKHPPLIDKQGEVRPLQAGDAVRLRPLADAFPELAAFAKRRRGRPKSAAPKRLHTFKLSGDIIDAIRASGGGYNVRVERVLREALEEGRI